MKFCFTAESRMSRDSRGYSRIAYTPDPNQLAVQEYLARKRGTPLPQERRRIPTDPEEDEVISFEKVRKA